MRLIALWPVTQQFQAKNGSNLVGGKVYIYYQGRTALATTYHDEAGTVVNPNPVLLDNNGRATVFADTIYSYTIVVCDYYGKELFSQDITLHDAISTAEDVIVLGSNGSVKVDNTTLPNGVQYDLSVNTDIIATKESVDNKKDKQNELNFNGSATKTVKSITQNANGELNVEFEDIDLPQEVPNVNITSEDSSVNITSSVDAATNTKTFDLSVDIESSDGSINVSSANGVTNLTLPSDVVRDSAYTHIDAATANPLMDGTAAVGVSTKYAREDHVHQSDTSKEDIANKTTVVLGTSNSKYPTDKAVADFVNSSIATNTANYISNNGEPFTSVEQLEAYSGPVTNNDYAFVTGTDSEGNTYYDRYKATVSGETVTWALEYRLNNSSFTAAQWSAINSGITSALVAKIHTHSNKDVLDGITSSDVANWNSKQNSLTAGDNITIDSDTISSNQVFSVIAWTTTYQEIKDAYNAGKICLINNSQRHYYITEITPESIKFSSMSPNPNIYSLTVTSDNKWSSYNPWLQTHLTFDATPTAGSSNPVTSDGIRTAINAKADGDNSVAICDGYMRRMNESAGWRRLAYKQFNYTNTNLNALFRLYYFGSNNEHIGLGDLIVNIRFDKSGSAPQFNTCDLLSHKSFNALVKVRVIGVAGNAVVELWFRPMTFSMLTLTCLGNGFDVTSRTKDWTFERYLDSTDPEPVEDIANNVYVFSGTVKRVQLDIDNPTSGNLVAMDAKGLVIDSGIRITSSDVANWNSKMDNQSAGNISEPVYIENGVPKVATDVATKDELNSRVPAPTSTTGTQVLKCIDGVVQWVTE